MTKMVKIFVLLFAIILPFSAPMATDIESVKNYTAELAGGGLKAMLHQK